MLTAPGGRVLLGSPPVVPTIVLSITGEVISHLLLDHFHCSSSLLWAGTALLLSSLTAQLVKNPPAMQETPVQFLGPEDLLEKGKATHSSILV